MLLFFLLIGRYLDKRARGRVRAAASGLLAMLEGTATVLQPDGSQQHFRIRDLQPGMRLQVAMGERIAAVVVPRPGATPTLDSLQQHFAAAGLAAFKRPERLRIAAQLPRNPLGKLLRAELSRIAEEHAPS